MSFDLPASKDVHGWLIISHECSETADWQKRYCVLARDERKLYFYMDHEAAMIKPPLSSLSVGTRMDRLTIDNTDGTVVSTMKRLGHGGSFSNNGGSESPFQRGARTSRSFREKVRSLHKNKKMQRSETHSATSGDLILPRMRGGRSLENIYRVSSGDSESQTTLGDPGTFIDLATKGTLNIQAVHASVSPRHSCFRVITDSDTIYASCGSAEELTRWVSGLNQYQQPNRDHLRRLNTQLGVWMFEARNLHFKKRYFCEIYLNGILYCQTCCKMMNEILFWGEPFVFEELPMLGSILIKLYKETYKKRDRSVEPIGKIEIPTLILESGQVTEKWYPVMLFQTPKAPPLNAKEIPAIRIKIQYQVVSILPLKSYDVLLKYLQSNFATLCDVFEPILNAKTKDEIAQTLLRILQYCGKAKEFLCDIIMAEVQHVDNENLIFRGNTFATKAVDTYMKTVGEGYLQETLTGFICQLLETEEDCEVDPTRILPTSSLQNNQQILTRLVKRVWFDILSSWTRFPSDLRNTLYGIRQRFGPEREEASYKLISGSIFLRFFCPAILSPSLFQLCQAYPDEKTARKLTLVAKVIQNLANFARFGIKEEYMCFMNGFMEEEVKNMKQFIERISSPIPDSCPVVEWGPFHVDLGRELSIMHTTLLNQIPNLKEESLAQVSELPLILKRITNTIEEDKEDPFSSTFEALRIMQSTISKFTPQSLQQTLSNSSSEYTTPAQSTSTSPTSERRPLSQVALISSPTHHTRQISAPVDWTGSSPTISPTHSANKFGHRPSSSFPQQQLHKIQTSASFNTPKDISSSRSMNIPSPIDLTTSFPLPEIITEIPSPRRNSDSALHNMDIKRKDSAPLEMSFSETSQTSQSSSEKQKSTDSTMSFRFDQTIHMAELTAENSHLLEELERLKQELGDSKAKTRVIEQENETLKRNLLKAEILQKRAEEVAKSLKENRGKILRGLNTQTEIALAQFTRDFEYMKKQLETKDEAIRMQEKKIKSLLEADCTLRNGVQRGHGVSHLPESESDDEGLHMHSQLTNGHTISPTSSLQMDLAKFIKQLDL